MDLWELLAGARKESHEDGSVTERFSNGESITQNPDDSIHESTSHEVGFGKAVTVTRDGDDKTINVQDGWGQVDLMPI